MISRIAFLCFFVSHIAVSCVNDQKPLASYVNPFLGTATLWDDYRNKLVLLGMLSPTVTADSSNCGQGRCYKNT
jgi:hypothetical protein